MNRACSPSWHRPLHLCSCPSHFFFYTPAVPMCPRQPANPRGPRTGRGSLSLQGLSEDNPLGGTESAIGWRRQGWSWRAAWRSLTAGPWRPDKAGQDPPSTFSVSLPPSLSSLSVSSASLFSLNPGWASHFLCHEMKEEQIRSVRQLLLSALLTSLGHMLHTASKAQFRISKIIVPLPRVHLNITIPSHISLLLSKRH